MEPDFIFHSASFDIELFRRQIIVLDENGIDYKVINKQSVRYARAPLSNQLESEIYIHKTDFEKADRLLKKLIEDFSWPIPLRTHTIQTT